ncbi:MAG: peptidylprolyl isomerase [Bacteroidales bacterium]|jgi:peptidyl-prolyl cis-trans isomerase SurA|nr:peptidylprolyl isomerase [Bacteroidales bacterium]
MKKEFLVILLIINSIIGFAQPKTVVDGIVAVVGKEIILKSDLEKAYLDYTKQFMVTDDDDDIRCTILERLLFNKLMVNQAFLDSVDVTDQMVDDRIDMQIAYFLQQVGGDTRQIEQYYNKSMSEIKRDMREIIREQMYMEQVQQKLTDKISITPTEVKTFFDKMPYDSLPMIQASYEFGHVLRQPPVSNEEIASIKERLNSYRDRVLRGEKFAVLARLYSDDPGSAAKGGDLGFVERGKLYPEFESVAFNLKTGEISAVVQSQAGYHIIQMIERRGETVNVAHILLQPKPSTEAQVQAIEYLDSIKKVILSGKMDFSQAAKRYSDDPNKNSGGWVINPGTMGTKFDKEAIDPTTFATLGKLIPDEYSEPVPYVNPDGQMGYRLLYLKSKVPAHKPNMVEDYDVIKNAALEAKKQNAIDKWVYEKVKITSIKITPEYKHCPFVQKWQIP